MDSGAEVYGTLVSDIQTDVEVTGKVIIPKTIESPYVSRNVPVKYCNYVDLKKIVGASVVWNNICKNGNFNDTSGWQKARLNLSANDNILNAEISELSVDQNGNRIGRIQEIKASHVYLISFYIKAPHNIQPRILFMGAHYESKVLQSIQANEWGHCNGIIKTSEVSPSYMITLNITNTSDFIVGDTVQFKDVFLTDLTAMFGTTIADYVNTLETSQSGRGITWLQSYGFFTEDYYEYTENKIESVCTNGRTSNGITYPISAVELRGLFNVDNGELTVDGDEYEADGTIKRKFASIKSFERLNIDSSGKLYRIAHITNSVNDIGICNLFPTTDLAKCRTNADNGINSICIYSNSIYVGGFVGNETELDNILPSLEVNYKLQTPNVELTTLFNERQKVGSTEQFDDYGVITGTRDVSIPVGNETDYLQNFAGQITGTLHYIEDGLAPSGYLSGSGNFIALHLESDDWTRYTSVKVGLDPSQASGMVEILDDEEKIAVGKITDNEQVFIVESTDGEFTKTDVYSLSDLVLETE